MNRIECSRQMKKVAVKHLFEKVETSAISPSLYLIEFSKTDLKNKR